MTNNYAVALELAEKRFCSYDMAVIAAKSGVFETETHIYTTFLGQKVEVEKATGKVTLDGRAGDLFEGLTIFDWLCDSQPDATASYEFCPVTSLPGVLVSGKGLTISGDRLARMIDRDPEAFCRICEEIGGVKIPMGDIGLQLTAHPGLPVQIKFYRSDEEFPASVTLLWDKNILHFLRYETVYYLAKCLLVRLEKGASR